MNTQTHTPAADVLTKSAVSLHGITKTFGTNTVVQPLDLSIGENEFFSILGPSGCGKTTLMRMITGFETPTDGTVKLGGTDVTNVPTRHRDLNMLFQSYALFPHLTVFENVAFELRVRKVAKPEITARTREVLELVKLGHLADRKPEQLSGGQRQRVALARAVVSNPKVVLLDEPLGALDQQLRKEMQFELKRLQREVGITFIYVTHDQEEALTMSDRIAVMSEGVVQQIDTPTNIYNAPATRFVAGFIGSCNLIDVEVPAGAQGGQVDITVEGMGVVRGVLSEDRYGVASGTMLVRPERIQISRDSGTVCARVTNMTFLGEEWHYVLTAGEHSLKVSVTSPYAERELAGVTEGTELFLSWLPEDARIVTR